MAQHNRIPYEMVEHTAIARKSYLEYERGMDDPDEAEIEAAWVAERKKLYQMLDRLTLRQRQVYIMKVGYRQREKVIAEKLGITQQTVSFHYRAARKKTQKILAK